MNASPLTTEIQALTWELQQQLPSYVNQLNRREVGLIYERITELRQYLQRLNPYQETQHTTPHTSHHHTSHHHTYTSRLQPQQYNPQSRHEVISITHDGFPLRNGEGNISFNMADGNRTVARGTHYDYQLLLQRYGLEPQAPPPPRAPQAPRRRREPRQTYQPAPPPRIVQQSPVIPQELMELAQQIAMQTVREHTRAVGPRADFFEMTLETPSWVVFAEDADELDVDELDVEMESLNMPQPRARAGALEVATKLPSSVYEAVETETKDEACPICLTNFVGGSIVRELPCKHIFHDGCALQWFIKNDICPKCRACILPAPRLANTTAPVRTTSHQHPAIRHRVNP